MNPNQEQAFNENLLENGIQIDLGQLRALSEDDPEFMIQILELISAQTPVVMEEMGECIDSGDFGRLKKVAHKYKSTVNILGNQEIRILLKSLEEESELGEHIDKITYLVDTCKGICNDLMNKIEEEMKKIKSLA